MMQVGANRPIVLRTEIQRWPLRSPFRITGHIFETIEILVVRLERGQGCGWAEASGVYYRNETAASMQAQVEQARKLIEAGIDRSELHMLFPPGGARNALDCALWDLEAKERGMSVSDLTIGQKPRRLTTTFTCGADTPTRMAAAAVAYEQARAIKLKLTGEPSDADRVRAVREARPEVWLGVDANQGFTRASLELLMPVLLDMRVELIEQPFVRGQEALLDGLQSPIPVAADESVQGLADLPALVGRVDVINIKLDKCGGLTEGLAMARAAHRLGLETMVGNMLGTSLSIAPAFLLGQLCKIVDLDGPIFLKEDRNVAVDYTEGTVMCPSTLWGDDTCVHSDVRRREA
jgi:L-alanine-DL-glutamate epimerase-like enolase superfamily enzyme